MEMIPIGKLCQHPDNPRKELGDLVDLLRALSGAALCRISLW